MMNRQAPVLAAVLALAAPFAAASFAVAQSSKPVAYIYVSSNYSHSDNRVAGYAASADGRLTEIPGSPWADNLSYLATNGSYLLGSTNIASDNGKNVFSYKVESNGALKYIGANNIDDAGSENECNVAENLMLDHTGSYLYVFVHDEGGCNSNGGAYQSFAVDKSTGLLNYLGVTDPTGFYAYPPTMLGNNDYAYAPQGDESDGSGEICGYKKASNGALVFTDSDSAVECGDSGSPGLANSNGQYFYVAADPTNHLAASMDFTDSTGALVTKIATIAINPANGAQSSNSSNDNMPASDVYPAISLVMAPGGKLLAVGGSNGIQIYRFNPLLQALPITGLISTADVTAMYWDTSNHLYAISNADGTLHVFTVTATGAEEAPGSPYFIPHPVALTGHSI
jgi:hypothetical protein